MPTAGTASYARIDYNYQHGSIPYGNGYERPGPRPAQLLLRLSNPKYNILPKGYPPVDLHKTYHIGGMNSHRAELRQHAYSGTEIYSEFDVWHTERGYKVHLQYTTLADLIRATPKPATIDDAKRRLIATGRDELIIDDVGNTTIETITPYATSRATDVAIRSVWRARYTVMLDVAQEAYLYCKVGRPCSIDIPVTLKSNAVSRAADIKASVSCTKGCDDKDPAWRADTVTPGTTNSAGEFNSRVRVSGERHRSGEINLAVALTATIR